MATKKTVLITGCSVGGIGEALAKEFHARGFWVIATARSASQISGLKALGIDCVDLVVDDPISLRRCYEQVEQLLGGVGLDYLINNAGQNVFRPAVEMDFEETKGMFAVNVLGVMAMNQTFFPRLLAAKGTIINCGSIGGVLPLPFDAAYSATKAALYAYSETLRIELAPFGVKVTYVQTGAVKTNLLRHKPALKEDSIYIPIKQRWEEKQEVLATSGVDPADFAKEFTHRVVGGHTDVFWIGQDAFNVRMISMLSRYLFFNPWSMIFSKDYQLNKLKVV